MSFVMELGKLSWPELMDRGRSGPVPAQRAMLDQRFDHSEWRHRCCQSRSSSGFTGIFEIVAADKTGVVG